MSPALEQAATDAVNAASTPDGQSAGRALRRSDFERVSNHSLGDRLDALTTRFYSSRRGYGGNAGAASLRPASGHGAEQRELSRAGVRVPVRRERFEQHRDPDGRHQLPSVHVDSRQPGAVGQRIDAHRVQRFQRAVRVSRQAGRSRQHVFEQRAGGGGEHRFAGAAAHAIAISRVAGAHPAQSVLAFRPAVAMADFHGTREQPHRLGRARGGLSEFAEDQLLELSRVPFGGGKFAGGPGRRNAAGGHRARAIADAERVQQLGGVPGAFECADNSADFRQRAFAGASRQQHHGEQHGRCGGAGGGAREDHAVEDAISNHQSRRRSCSRWRRSSRCNRIWA